jgi:hypothetical protein
MIPIRVTSQTVMRLWLSYYHSTRNQKKLKTQKGMGLVIIMHESSTGYTV